jgi:hypothetical protein
MRLDLTQAAPLGLLAHLTTDDLDSSALSPRGE